jgi:hypothetical protein
MPSSISISVAGRAAFYRAVWINNVPPQDNHELKAELKALPGMIKVSPNFGDPRLYVVSSSEELEPILECFKKFGYTVTRGR